MNKNGMFITLEGGEGAGKTTLMKALGSFLRAQGISVIEIREPGGTRLGEAIRELVLHSKESISPYAELALFLASRAQHVSEVILPSLRSGAWVLCDRFHDSTVAYQGGARGLGMEEVSQFCRFISGFLDPDLTLYLDLDPSEGLLRAKSRCAQDRIESENLSFHQKIRDSFLAIHKKDPNRFRLLDASLPLDAVYKKAIVILEEAFPKSFLSKKGHV